MEIKKVLFDDGEHKCIMFSLEDEEQELNTLAVNQFLLIQGESAILIDPGSASIFPDMLHHVSEYINPDNIKYIFFSHQDPDVAGSIAEWSIATSAKLVISQLWTRFMGHYGLVDSSRIIPIPDHGARISFQNDYLQFVPAHFLHSPGNFSLYDSRSKILFSGDIGAAILSPQNINKKVIDFSNHLPHLESFHKRYMASNRFCRAWVTQVRRYDVNVIAPQHGSLFEGEFVASFLEWFENLECAEENIESIYREDIK